MASKEPKDNPSLVPEVSDAEREEAEKQGAKNALTKSGETNFITQSETLNPDAVGDRWPDRSDVQQYASLLDLSPEEFEKRIDPKAEKGIPESKVAGLLGMERSGQNRTEFVQLMMKRLDVKSPYEVTPAGPAWTNDIRKLSAL